MKFIESVALAFSAILAHKLRSFLTLLGIIFGVATVIVVVSLIEGFNKYFNDKIADLGSNAFVVNKMGIVTSMQDWIERNKKNKDKPYYIYGIRVYTMVIKLTDLQTSLYLLFMIILKN